MIGDNSYNTITSNMQNYYNVRINSQNNKVKDNGTLLISEVKNKIFLPYKGEEVEEILDDRDNNFKTPEEVIENIFTRPFDNYRNQHIARFRESMELITQREMWSKIKGTELGIELMRKKLLHPAIITACKSLKELNVYLDCLDKNELDDFKIFEIKYEINPIIKKN